MSMSIDKRKAEKNNCGVLQILESWHREFDFVTACYLLEPWERRIVKGVTIFISYIFLPSFAPQRILLVILLF